MLRKFSPCLFLILLLFNLPLYAQTASGAQRGALSTREMERINWMEFREFVPSRIQTVLLPTGTLEPHGVINSQARPSPRCSQCRRELWSHTA